MDEAISKASVCEILADMYPTDGEKVVSVKSIDEAYDKIIKLPTIQSEQQWISCSERLPENGHNYLYCTDMGTVHMGFYFDGYGFEYGIKYGYDIVAWMPLPEPPKEDDYDHT